MLLLSGRWQEEIIDRRKQGSISHDAEGPWSFLLTGGVPSSSPTPGTVQLERFGPVPGLSSSSVDAGFCEDSF